MTDSTTQTRSLDEALADLRFAMVGTADGSTWKARPLTLVEQDGDVLRFLVPSTADWVDALDRAGSRAAATFSDPGQNSYVALQGAARISHDRGLVERLWNPAAAAYFDGTDDPTIRVLEISVDAGEYWDGPAGRVGQMISIVKTAVGDGPGSQGDIVT